MKLFLWTSCVVCLVSNILAQCIFSNQGANVTSEAQRRLKLIEDKLQRTSITEDAPDGYVYKIGVCKSAELVRGADTKKYSRAGVTQIHKDSAAVKEPVIIGSLDSVAVVAGRDWLFLEYFNGDSYPNSCEHENRTARIMFTCVPGVLQAHGRVLEENKKKTHNCYYLFEIELDAVCPIVTPEEQKLSTGSVLCIIFLVLVGVYMIGGALYQRVVVGAKGMEQIPHYTFWQDFGNLQADGCDLLCRSGGQTRGSREYRGIGDDQIHPPPDDEVGQDDNLLPM